MKTNINRQIDLSGTWDFVADLDPKYRMDTRVYPFPPYADPSGNRRHWLQVPVPGVWQKYAERYDIFEGVCWFAREFSLDTFSNAARARLRFCGVNYLCRVFVNGSEIGGHEGGYTEFFLDCSGKLKSGINHIAVMVDNRAATLKWPPVLGYFNYGGIHRKVFLEIVDGPQLDDITIDAVPPNAGREAEISVSGTVVDPAALVSIHVSCTGVGRDFPVNADGSFSCSFRAADINCWTPEKPILYDLLLTLLVPTSKGSDLREIVDSVSYRVGFRSISAVGGKVLLNGAEYLLKGICYVYDSPVTGLVMTEEQLRQDVMLMKEMGCNAVRCHYPMDDAFYLICDEVGLLVWIEPPVYCYHPRNEETGTFFADPSFVTAAESIIGEMIVSARNHPSVAIYGIGNECNAENVEAEQFFTRLADLVRRLDSSRLVSYAAIYGNVGHLASLVDILGINSYWGWYDKVFGGKGLQPDKVSDTNVVREPIDLLQMHTMLENVLKGKSNLALLMTEFGADSIPGFFSNSRDLWSENYHADLLEEILKLVEGYPQIVGAFPFCFSDYRDPSKTPNGYWNELNMKGVVDYRRNRKTAFHILKAFYNRFKSMEESAAPGS